VPSRSEGRHWAPLARRLKGHGTSRVPSRSEGRRWAGSRFTGTKLTRRKSMAGRCVGMAISRRRPSVDLRSAKDRLFERQDAPSRSEGRQWAGSRFTGTKLTRRKSVASQCVGTAIGWLGLSLRSPATFDNSREGAPFTPAARESPCPRWRRSERVGRGGRGRSSRGRCRAGCRAWRSGPWVSRECR